MASAQSPGDPATTSDEAIADFSLAEGLERGDRVPDLQLGIAQEHVRRALFGVTVTEHRVDRFTLLESVGRGGMGEVFAAYDPQLDRRVAIKLVPARSRLGHRLRNQDELLAEARAMAKVAHPNIVPVFEVGMHMPEGGEPSVFIAMEFVRGATLRAWVREAKPRWQRIVHAYRDAGRGLAAVHAAGLVHRDFKPDNVMIDDDGHVRVTDFGLAHDLESAERPHPTPQERGETLDVITRSGRFTGTPAYMAPEQLEGKPVDHRTDQFALCVALYEALWGRRPWAGASITALVLAVLGDAGPPQPPRSAVPPRIRQAILRGLARHPDDRWPSMPALVQALDDSPKRGWWRAVAGVGVVAAGVAALWRSGSASPCATAGAEIDVAWNHESRARVAANFAAFDRLDASDTTERASRAIDDYAREWNAMRQEACLATHVHHVQSAAMLDLRTMCLDARIAQVRGLIEIFGSATDPTIVTEAMPAVAALPAVAACGDLDALAAVVPLPEAPGDRTRLIALQERLAQDSAALDVGAHTVNVARVAALVDDARALGYPPMVAGALLLHANVLRETGEPGQAEPLLEQAALAAAAGADDRLLARIWTRLVMVRGNDQGRAREAVALRSPLEAALLRASSPASMRADAAVAIGLALMQAGDLDEAGVVLTDAVTLHERERPDDRLGLAAALDALGKVKRKQGERDVAEMLARRTLTLLREGLGDSHPRVAHARSQLAGVLQDLDLDDEAEQELLLALAIYDGTTGRDNRFVGLALNSLGNVARKRGDIERAQGHYDGAWTVLERVGGADGADAGMVLNNLAVVHVLRGQHERALEMNARSRAIWVELHGEHDTRVATIDANTAGILGELRRWEQAVVLWERAIATFESKLGAAHPTALRLRLPLSDAYRRLGRNDDALRTIRVAYETLAARSETTPDELALTKYALAMALWEVGRERPRALTLADEAYATLSGSSGYDRTQAGLVAEWITVRRLRGAGR